MPKQRAVIDYHQCEPEQCPQGTCAAVQVCEKHILIQIRPYEMPDMKPGLCLGCSDCVQACPLDAIRMM
jgi:ATP-binding cassette subfamily E protein 1